jgi:hypothetical protein
MGDRCAFSLMLLDEDSRPKGRCLFLEANGGWVRASHHHSPLKIGEARLRAVYTKACPQSMRRG